MHFFLALNNSLLARQKLADYWNEHYGNVMQKHWPSAGWNHAVISRPVEATNKPMMSRTGTAQDILDNEKSGR